MATGKANICGNTCSLAHIGRFSYTIRKGEEYEVVRISPCRAVAMVRGADGLQVVPTDCLLGLAGCDDCDDCGQCRRSEPENKRLYLEAQELAEYRARRRL
jgi:hypothetical protein